MSNEKLPISVSENESHTYSVRPKRDRAVVAIPGILWQTNGHGKSEHSKADKEISATSLDARVLELYALAQEYAMEPASESTALLSARINAFADLDSVPEDQTDQYIDSLMELFEQGASNTHLHSSGKSNLLELSADEAQAFYILTEERRERLKVAILDLMADPELRARYEAEFAHERSIRRAKKTTKRLYDVLDMRTFRSRLQSERRKLRIDELLAREESDGITRPKTPGRTPKAVSALDRGITLVENKESKIVATLSAPERGLLATEMLLAGKRELETKGFVMTPSREHLVTEIADLTAQGFRVFLGGPTGTGKTALALFALKELTNGSFSWVTWTGETSVRDLFGSPKLTTNPETGKLESGMTKGPMMRAITGERRGILHEELTSGQTSVQMSMKTLWANRPGDAVNLPGWNGSEFTKEEVIEIATGNLKGKRHKERETMDPAVAREFKALEVSFMPANEMRDIVLMDIIDRSGIMPLSQGEIMMIEQFCRAAELSQMAYLEEISDEVKNSDLYKIVSPSGENVALSSVFLDTGTVKDLFSGWRASGRSLASYLGDGVKRFIDTNPHFKEAKSERETLKNILRAYGFNLETSPDDKFFTPITSRQFVSEHPYLRPSELGFLIPGIPPSNEDDYDETEGYFKTPEGKRIDYYIKEFVTPEGTLSPRQRFKIKGEDWIFMGINKASGELIYKRAPLIVETVPEPESKTGVVSLAEALRIMGPELFRGPEQVEQVFGFKPEVPPILFTKAELKRAQERGERLVLRSAKDGEGNPLSLARMQEILESKWKPNNQGVLDTPDGWRNITGDGRFRTETCRGGWALVSLDLLPDSFNMDYFDQTDLLITELKTEVYKGQSLPKQYQEAIVEYQSQKAELQTLAADDTKWKESAKRLSELAITQLMRPSHAEDLFDLFMDRGITGRPARADKYNWTSSLSSVGSLVCVGLFDARGVCGDRWRPLHARSIMGASFSRSPR